MLIKRSTKRGFWLGGQREEYRPSFKPDGRGSTRLTDAGADLAGVIGLLGPWGERWDDVTRRPSDPAL